MALEKINPALYITDTDPINEEIIDISGWYETEYNTTQDKDSVPFMMAQGWQIVRHGIITHPDGVKDHTYDLKRRVLQPEKVLQSVIDSQTGAYNEGRQLNDSRYDEIVTLYTLMLDKTEDELNSINAEDSTYDALVEPILASMDDDYAAYAVAVDALADGFGVSELTRITTQFNAKLAEVKQSLINRGMNNSTLLDSLTAGVERERAIAVTDLNDKINERSLSIEDRKMKARTDIRLAILSARDRLRVLLTKGEENHAIMRNRVLDSLLAFMERRTDGYPDLTAQSKIISDLGAGSASYPTP